MKKKLVIILVVAAAVAVGVYFFMPSNKQVEASVFTTAEVTSQNVVQSITATGTVEPVTLVDVGTQVSGILTSLYVDYNSVVKKGQVIAELDKSTLTLDLNSNKNNLLVAQSEYDYQLANYTRIKALFDKGHIADSEYEVALYTYETTKNNLEVAKNNLERSAINLGYATIYSPIDGVVISKDVEEGQTVASSFSTPTLFTIAADLSDMRVIADVDEADIGNVTEGQKAQFTVDAFPGQIFEGEVTQVRQEAIVESNVVTYEVVISAANPDLKLKPGLTANVEIFVLDVACESTVPVAALTFTMPEPENAPEGAPQGTVEGAPAERRPMPTGDVVWVKDGEKVTPREVTIGVTNGIITEVEGVKAGETVVIGVKEGASLEPKGGESSSNPFLPQRPGSSKK
ncbi:MAG: efflux RND transporter periplasmic adaptor subunit [Rikenellaceae bacterium]